MDLAGYLLKNLGIKDLSERSLRTAIAACASAIDNTERKQINREVAHNVIKLTEKQISGNNYPVIGAPSALPHTKVLGVNHAGPLDITIEWKTGPNGDLELDRCHVDPGGDQVNVSKVFSNFDRNIALVALTGQADGEITRQWEKNFLTGRIIPSLIRDNREDSLAAIYHIIDGDILPGIFAWQEELSEETILAINNSTLSMLGEMSKGSSGNIWMVISAGGPLRYNADLAYYSSLIRNVKAKYQDRVKLLIDFKFMAGPEEALSVLEVPRDIPQDIIKPNLEEFIQLLVSSGLAEPGTLDKNTITEDLIRKLAVQLREKYNLMGVLVSMDRHGLMLAATDRIIREKGVKIQPGCHTAAGDSLKAGFVLALSDGKTFEEAVHAANLFGASTASMEGSKTVTPEKLAEIETLARSQNVAPEVEPLSEKT